MYRMMKLHVDTAEEYINLAIRVIEYPELVNLYIQKANEQLIMANI